MSSLNLQRKRKAKPKVLNVFGNDDEENHGEHQLHQLHQLDHHHPQQQQQEEDQAAPEEVDPLDAFMQNLEETEAAAKGDGDDAREKEARLLAKDLAEEEEEDHVASFLEARSKGSQLASTSRDGEREEREKQLKWVNHSQVEYMSFRKNFFVESPEIAQMSPAEVDAYRRSLDNITATGKKKKKEHGGRDQSIPKPIKGWHQCGFDSSVLQVIEKVLGFAKPTPIQCQALPVIMQGNDVLGIAKTGSGKTAAFVLPMIPHILDQPKLGKGEGPVAVLVAPTRELAVQILAEVKKLSKHFGIASTGIFGGMSKTEQFKALRGVCDVVVCTPGRMIDLLKMKACSFKRVTYLVLDEADRMLDMGFEDQVFSLVNQVRPDRQTALFSATMPRRIENLAQQTLHDSRIKISCGKAGEANEDVKQVVHVLQSCHQKIHWLFDHLEHFQNEGQVIVFVSQRAGVEEVVHLLSQKGYRAAGLHGDMNQHNRIAVLGDFKRQAVHTLVATDVASRGLDIKSVKTVVNLDAAKDLETHIHRIGRTGRAGDKSGTAYTLVTRSPDQSRLAGVLVECLSKSNQEIPRDLYALALQDKRFAHHGRQRTSPSWQSTQSTGSNGKRRQTLPDRPSLGLNYSQKRERSKGERRAPPSFVAAKNVSSSRPVESVTVTQPVVNQKRQRTDHPSEEEYLNQARAAASAIAKRLVDEQQQQQQQQASLHQSNAGKSAAQAAEFISKRIDKLQERG